MAILYGCAFSIVCTDKKKIRLKLQEWLAKKVERCTDESTGIYITNLHQFVVENFRTDSIQPNTVTKDEVLEACKNIGLLENDDVPDRTAANCDAYPFTNLLVFTNCSQ